MVRTIPEIRIRLHELATELKCDELHDLAEETKRRPAVRMTRIKHPPLSDEVKALVREYAEEFPDTSQQEIAVCFGTNTGRISEVLAGKRGE